MSQTITETSTEIDRAFTNIQAITENVGNLDTKIDTAIIDIDIDLNDLKNAIDRLNYSVVAVNAHIRSGLLYYDEGEVPVYGLEIGQINTIDGVEVFNKYARFTADRLSFYDQNDTEVAYISDYKLYITHVQVRGSLQEGGYKDFIDANGGIVTRWVGGE
jgi:hypothetical protein